MLDYLILVIMTSYNNCHLDMTSAPTILELQEHHIDEAADVLTRSFLQLNTIWKVYNPKYHQIFPIMRAKIYPSLGKGWSFVPLHSLRSSWKTKKLSEFACNMICLIISMSPPYLPILNSLQLYQRQEGSWKVNLTSLDSLAGM